MGYEQLGRWINWHLCNRFVATVRADDESLLGVLVFRLIMEPMDAFEPFSYDKEGRGYYVAELVCTDRDAFKALGLALLQQYGEREFVCYQRAPDYKLVCRSTKSFRKNLLRQAFPQNEPAFNALGARPSI